MVVMTRINAVTSSGPKCNFHNYFELLKTLLKCARISNLTLWSAFKFLDSKFLPKFYLDLVVVIN